MVTEYFRARLQNAGSCRFPLDQAAFDAAPQGHGELTAGKMLGQVNKLGPIGKVMKII